MAARRWTVLVWMAGDNDLKSYAARDLKEMKTVGSSDDLAVVAQLDTKKKGTVRYYLRSGTKLEKDEVADLGVTNTGDPAVAAAFFEWGIKTYPSDNVLAILWNHGSGIDETDIYRRARGTRSSRAVLPPPHVRGLAARGFRRSLFSTTVTQAVKQRAIGYDDSARDFLDNVELAQVLERVTQRTDRKISLVGFDACLMGMLEIALQCQPYAGALVGAQEVEPLDGWPYDTVLRDLASHPQWQPVDLGRCVVDRYLESYRGADQITLSTLNLAAADDTSAAVDRLASVLLAKAKADRDVQGQIVLAAMRAQRFDTPGFLDLGSLCVELETSLSGGDVKSASRAVRASLHEGPTPLVVHEGHSGASVERATGVSIYLPMTRLSVAYERLDLARRTHWGDLVRAFDGWINPSAGTRASVGAGRVAPVTGARAEEPSFRVLAVHGIAGVERDLGWQDDWKRGLKEGIGRYTTRVVEVEFLPLDDIFEAIPLRPRDIAEATARLGWSGLVYGLQDSRTGARGLGSTLRWTAGMVVQWAANERLQQATRDRLAGYLQNHGPFQLVAAHSLGSLISYDLFARPATRKLLQNSVFFTFGSQIGSSFVRAQFGGYIQPLEAEYWYHAYNPHDPVFTAPLNVAGDRFRQLLVDEDLPGLLTEHDAMRYLGSPEVVDTVYRDVANASSGVRAVAGSRRTAVASSRTVWRKKSAQRALLIGINDYPDPAARLGGCVNDVYLMSAALQELGQPPEDIRIVLNERATACAMRERIEWLLDGVGDADTRILYYSGHGAQIPGYGDEEVDRVDECLVPWDFDWTVERAVVDNWLNRLYAQLPYKSQFVALLDCCHSGGMARAGGAKIRGLNPPDDIRHRLMEWQAGQREWSVRRVAPPNAAGLHTWRADPGRVGQDGDVRKLGRGLSLRWLDDRKDHRRDRVRKAFAHKGPYMPVLLEACGEQELAYEHAAGTVRHGAFTYFLVDAMRSLRAAKEPLTFKKLVAKTAARVGRLYQQTPQLEGPTSRLGEKLG